MHILQIFHTGGSEPVPREAGPSVFALSPGVIDLGALPALPSGIAWILIIIVP